MRCDPTRREARGPTSPTKCFLGNILQGNFLWPIPEISTFSFLGAINSYQIYCTFLEGELHIKQQKEQERKRKEKKETERQGKGKRKKTKEKENS